MTLGYFQRYTGDTCRLFSQSWNSQGGMQKPKATAEFPEFYYAAEGDKHVIVRVIEAIDWLTTWKRLFNGAISKPTTIKVWEPLIDTLDTKPRRSYINIYYIIPSMWTHPNTLHIFVLQLLQSLQGDERSQFLSLYHLHQLWMTHHVWAAKPNTVRLWSFLWLTMSNTSI